VYIEGDKAAGLSSSPAASAAAAAPRESLTVAAAAAAPRETPAAAAAAAAHLLLSDSDVQFGIMIKKGVGGTCPYRWVGGQGPGPSLSL
jgi:hypothetical protein